MKTINVSNDVYEMIEELAEFNNLKVDETIVHILMNFYLNNVTKRLKVFNKELIGDADENS